MKYFNNITSKEELKKKFREYCVTMHPDKGGNAEEFKAMVAEYNEFNANFERIAQQQAEEEEARKRAEEYRKAEEERKRKEEEEARKAAEALQGIIAKWSSILEAVKPLNGWYDSQDTNYAATVKRNIKKILCKYFPGVNFSVSLKNGRWKESATISWADGPTVDQLEDIKELKYFISHYHVCDPYEDYGHEEECKNNRAWRKQFGQILADRFDFKRTFSELGKAEVLGKIYEVFPQFDGMTKRSDSAFISADDTTKLEKFFGFWHSATPEEWRAMSQEEKEEAQKYDDQFREQRRVCDNLETDTQWGDKTTLRRVLDVFDRYYTVSDETTKAAAEAAAAPVFTPKHCKTWQAIKKALGANVFGVPADTNKWHLKEVSFLEAADLLANDQKVFLGKPWIYEGELQISGVTSGGAKTQQKRAEKFAAVGIQISCYGYNSLKDVEVLQFSQNVIAELRKDAEEVEKQRKAWEEEQKNGKQTGRKTAQRAKSSDNTDSTSADTDKAAAQDATDEAPADGLELVEIADGVAVVGDSRTTYRNRKQIKAHGATWNKAAQQWQATDPEAVARLRQWFRVVESSSTAQAAEETAANNQDAQATAANEQPAEQPQTEHPQAEAPAEESAAQDETVEQITDTDRASLSALSGLAFALRSVASSILSAFEDWKTDDLHAKNLRQSIAQDLEEIKKLNERIRTMSEELEAINERQEQRAGRTDAAATDEQPTEQPQAEEPTVQATQGAQATAADEQATQQADTGGGKPDRTEMLRAAAEDANNRLEQGDTIGAYLARCYILLLFGVQVHDIIEALRSLQSSSFEKNASYEELASVINMRFDIEERAVLHLKADAFRILFGHDPKSSNKAA